MIQAFSKHSLIPTPGGVTEHVCARAFSFELESGAYPGVRIAFEDPHGDAWGAKSIRFDRAAAQMPAHGVQRFWLVWPATMPTTTPVVVTTWHIEGASYARRLGDVALSPFVHVLHSAEQTMGGGSEFIGPFQNLPWEPWSTDAVAFMQRGGRLCGHFGFEAGGGVADVSLQLKPVSGGTFRTTEPRRCVGAPTAPTSILGTVFDTPAPLGEFRFRCGANAGAILMAHVYLELRP